MNTLAPLIRPNRITDLVTLKKKGASVTCRTDFEILPVDFQHRDNPFQAFIFLCRYTGEVDEKDYGFRKCYARGCPNNLCPNVSQAVMIANRYLQKAYRKLGQAGIAMDKKWLISRSPVWAVPITMNGAWPAFPWTRKVRKRRKKWKSPTSACACFTKSLMPPT